ncbi:MAG: CusA/CzcA family heavy metal efflux RND transporter [Candidatus Krumholzibacteria bacterium]|jgi:cobalt-zinc-cadmium resistance protein CzcA|nr:CusA/CzcA family heavy metal efflux RND transporter [Candidatus Krumholzibacteria bacterium]
MLNAIISWSLKNRILVIALTLVMLIAGVATLLRLPLDAFPDTTPVQVQVNTSAPALSPLEIEQQITIVVEQAIAGLSGLEGVRSISKFGLSQITVTFDDDTDVYFARQLIMERLQSVELPEEISRPEMGPVATGLGEIYHYSLRSTEHSLRELTTLHDWVVKPQLRSVPGVAEVNTWGGEKKQYQVLADPALLVKYKFTLEEVLQALESNNLNVGGGYLVRAGELHVVQGISLTTNLEEIGKILVATHDGIPIHIRDIGEVREGHEIRRGAATANGEGEIVLGLGFMLMGENSHEMSSLLRERMEKIRQSLPEGVELNSLYERSKLVDQVLDTVRENLLEGAILVIAVLFAFLGNFRAGLIVASAIPLSMLFAAQGMMRFGVAGSLMSLGAIDFGLIVDSSVIMVENSVRRLASSDRRASVLDTVRDAAIEVRKPTMYGELIIATVFLPVLTLEGIEGKLFRPMALTLLFALAGSLILSLTLMPVLASLLLKVKSKERENWFAREAKRLYAPLVAFSLRRRKSVIAGALVLLAVSATLIPFIGSEFIPRLSEGDIVINAVRLSGISLEESIRYGSQIEKVILEQYPDEVSHVWSRTGTAEVATDPMGVELTDIYISLTPRREWTQAGSQDELVDLMSEELSKLPGMRLVFTQPIELRMNEMVAGIRTDIGVKIFGDDLDQLRNIAIQVGAIIDGIEGSADLYVEQITGQPVLQIQVKQDAIARHGVSAEQVLAYVEAIGGVVVGQVREDQRRFDLVLRLPGKYRSKPDAVRQILVSTETGGQIPLSQLADIRQIEGPSTITREWQRRRIVVQCNVRGRDVGSFVEEAREQIAEEITLPQGYHVSFAGQFEHMERARLRLMFVVPLALLLVFFLLYSSTKSLRDSLIIFTGAPFAALGGLVSLLLRGMPFTVSAGVGFVAVSGVAMLAGLVLVSTIRRLLDEGVDLETAIEQSALMRLRPILMTTLVAALGFVPMALNTGIGAEIQRPLATVVIGGVLSANVLTLLVLPAIYRLFGASVDIKKTTT